MEEVAREIEAAQIIAESYWSPGQVAHFGPNSRTLGFIGDVDEQLCGAFISQLSGLVQADPEAPIFVHINTGGGSVIDALAVHDFIRACTAPVCAIVAGNCMSAGLTVLSACDYRISTENSMFFYHQVLMTINEACSEAEVDSKAELYRYLNQKNDQIIRERSKISKAKWKKEFAGSISKFLTAPEALELGIIDGMICPIKKKAGLKELIESLNGGPNG